MISTRAMFAVFCLIFSLFLIVETSPVMTDKLRIVALKAHNDLRSTVAVGKAINKNGTALPKAANMRKLTYSKLVEQYAQKHADSCEWKHRVFNETSNNLHSLCSQTYGEPGKNLNDAVYSWYSELSKDGQPSLNSGFNHFTQVVWAEVQHIGCAVSNCSKMVGMDLPEGMVATFVVCDYWPYGNINGVPIYEASSLPAQNCPKGSVGNSTSGLCEIQGLPDIHE